jgi:hypothetical protein
MMDVLRVAVKVDLMDNFLAGKKENRSVDKKAR